MTGKKMLDTALSLLGYERNEQIQNSALTVVNMVYGELYYKENKEGFTPLSSLNDNIELPERVVNDVMIYGVAAAIAAGQYDGEKQQLFAVLYNKKRVKACTNTEITDTLPTPS